jgi:hypothetical protein
MSKYLRCRWLVPNFNPADTIAAIASLLRACTHRSFAHYFSASSANRTFFSVHYFPFFRSNLRFILRGMSTSICFCLIRQLYSCVISYILQFFIYGLLHRGHTRLFTMTFEPLRLILRNFFSPSLIKYPQFLHCITWPVIMSE